MPDRLSTGVDVIDRHMRGGVPVGSLLVLAAPPESQSDLLVSAPASVADTRYLTADRTPEAVRERLRRPADAGSDLTVTAVTPETFVADPSAALDGVPREGYLVVDGFDEFERLPPDDQLLALGRLGARLRERNSVGLLHCAAQESRTDARRRTLRVADVVWRLHLGVTTLTVETRLTITKVRGGATHLEPVKLKLSDGVVVDTSRDIA
jgi:hypothetical protein